MTNKKKASSNPYFEMPQIGNSAPKFTAETTRGEINFPDDYQGKWVLFFSHPADFTPVCTSEFMAAASMYDQFAAANCALVGLSCDTIRSHVEWLQRIKDNVEYKGMKNVEVKFPLVADWRKEVASLYGMIQPNENEVHAVRAVFIIDPDGVVRLMSYYPNNIGRNMDELYRALIAMQTAKNFDVYIPANWQPGDDVIDPSASAKAARDQENKIPKGTTDHDWFFWTKKLSKRRVLKAIETL